MIDRGLYAMSKEHVGYLFCIVTTHAIDDATFIGTFEDKFEYRPCLFLLLVSSAYIEDQVRPVERRYEGLRVFQIQLCHDVLTGNLVRRGGECHNRCLWKLFADSFQLGVFRSEVVSPLRDAVCLVDGEKRHLDFFQQKIHFHQQAFRRDVEQFYFTLITFPAEHHVFRIVVVAVQRPCGNAVGL